MSSLIYPFRLGYLDRLERVIERAVASAAPRDWNEDFITRTWIRELLALSRDGGPGGFGVAPFGVALDAFKATGRLEVDHGDVAFLVRLRFPGGGSTEGVGLLEAKRSDGAGGFPAFRKDQLETHLAHSSAHKTLLYDTSIVPNYPVLDRSQVSDDGRTGFGLAASIAGFPDKAASWRYRECKATTLPTPHVLALDDYSAALHRYSIPLSYQIGARYLHGLDLDYNPVLVRKVKKGPNTSLWNGINYVVVAEVSLAPETHPDPGRDRFTPEGYARLEVPRRRRLPSDPRRKPREDDDESSGQSMGMSV